MGLIVGFKKIKFALDIYPVLLMETSKVITKGSYFFKYLFFQLNLSRLRIEIILHAWIDTSRT